MLGENIRALRKARGLSQQELAERLHVVRQTVSKWEQGLSVPDADMLVRLAECLEVSVEAPLLEMGRHRRRDMRAVAVAAASAYPAHAGVWPPGQ